MAIESAVASNNAAALTTPNVRREESTPGIAPLSAPQAAPVNGASQQPASQDVAVQVSTPDLNQQSILDRVSDTQQARDVVNQVQDSLIEQRSLATEAESAPEAEQPRLVEQQASLQADRTALVEQERGAEGANEAIENLGVTLEAQGLTGETDELPTADQLADGLEQVGSLQSDLDRQDALLTADFNAAQDSRLQGSAGAVTNPSEADALLSRVLENENELVRTSNAVDDQQRQQTLNLLTV